MMIHPDRKKVDLLVKRFKQVKASAYNLDYATSDLAGWLRVRFNIVLPPDLADIPEAELEGIVHALKWICRNNSIEILDILEGGY